MVPSFADPAIVAGQGTVGLEILAQLAEAGEQPPARIVIPCGGGGLSSGIALACPDADIVLVEPEGWDDMAPLARGGRDRAGCPRRAADFVRRAADAAMSRRSRSDILEARRAKALAVSDEEVTEAIRFAWKEHGLVVEPGGAAALAAILAGKAEAESRHGGDPVGRQYRPGAPRADRRGLGRRCGSYIRRARRGPGWSARPPGSAPRARRPGSSVRRRGSGARPRRRIRMRRSAFRASLRCTAGSFPRSARTPLQGALAARASACRAMWTDLG